MLSKIMLWASLPMLVMPLISLGAAPASSESLQSQPSLKLELLSTRNSKSVLIADQYQYRDNSPSGDRDNSQNRSRDNYQSGDRDNSQNRSRDNSQNHDSGYYRSWYNTHQNENKGYSYRWYNNHYHGNSDQYYRWYYNQYHH